MNPRLRFVSVALVWTSALVALPASADLSVRFTEGAPKDRFEFTNIATCPLQAAEVTLDLSGSAAGLIFDVTNQGAGVEVFQPFELVAGADALNALPRVADGDRQVVLNIRRLGPGQTIAFTIDVDDTLGPRGITVSESEIEGAVVRVRSAEVAQSGRFSRQGVATVKTRPCA